MVILDLQTGAHALLLKTVEILNQLDVSYVIVGGWSPYLLTDGDIKHPGTKDVDILFDNAYEKEYLSNVIKVLLENGFTLSAKHDFQLFTDFNIAGKRFIYNIDLLHPNESAWGAHSDLFVDQIDLGIPIARHQSGNFGIRSIALGSAATILKSGLYFEYELNEGFLSSIDSPVTFKLIDEAGCILSKSQSVLIPKRERDALDIYLSIVQARNKSLVIEKILHLRENDPSSYNSLYGIKEAYQNGLFLKNLYKKINKDYYPQEVVAEAMEEFFASTSLDQKAQDTYNR